MCFFAIYLILAIFISIILLLEIIIQYLTLILRYFYALVRGLSLIFLMSSETADLLSSNNGGGGGPTLLMSVP